MPDVICCGEALVDRLGAVGAASPEHGPRDDRLGGAPANVCCALAQLGTSCGFLGRIGRDDIGAAFSRLFTERGVDRQGLQWDEQRPSRIVLVRRSHTGERCFGGFCGNRGEGFADTALNRDLIQASLFNHVQWFVSGTIPLAAPRSAAALQHAVSLATRQKVRLAVDLNWRPTFWPAGAAAAQAQMWPLLEKVHLLKLAEEEAEWLFAEQDPGAVSARLPQRPAVVVTAGASGVSWWMGGRAGHRPAFPVSAVDTTGAGDAFLAGLLHQLVRQPSLLDTADARALDQAMAFACACGALVCTAAGAIDPQPREKEVAAFLRKRA